MTPAPDERWVSLVSTQGLAVAISLFCMVVVFPVCVVGLRAFANWGGRQIEAYLESSNKCINATVGTLQQSVETQETLKDMLETSVATANLRHDESQKSLLEIKHSIDSLHVAVTSAAIRAGVDASSAASAAAAVKSDLSHK